MTESSVVRATARVGDPAGAAEAQPVLVPRRTPGRLGKLHLLQLLLIEVVLLAAAITAGFGVTVVSIVGGVGLILIVLVLLRRRDRWWLEKQLMAWRYRRRQRTQPADSPKTDARLTAMRTLSPGLTIREQSLADGARLGVARDAAGWYAVAMLQPTAGMRDDPADGLPTDRMVKLLADSGAPGVMLQVVMHTLPAPAPVAGPPGPVSQSYHKLQRLVGAAAAPRDRVTWIVVRLDAQAMAEGTGGDTPPADPPTVLSTLMRRLLALLRRIGRPCRPLGADDLLDALVRSCDLEPSAANLGEPTRARESWTSCQTGQLAHASFWLRDWPPVADATALIQSFCTVPAAIVSVALILVPEPAGTDVRCLVRVASPEAVLATASAAVQQCAERHQAHLMRLDGEQGPAVYATAPTGGGAR